MQSVIPNVKVDRCRCPTRAGGAILFHARALCHPFLNPSSTAPTAPFHLRSILALVPPWVRVYRVQRDIPMPLVTSGVEKGNLRELVSHPSPWAPKLGLCPGLSLLSAGWQSRWARRRLETPSVAANPGRQPHLHRPSPPALARMGALGLRCRDVRTREAGIQDIHHQASQLWPGLTFRGLTRRFDRCGDIAT